MGQSSDICRPDIECNGCQDATSSVQQITHPNLLSQELLLASRIGDPVRTRIAILSGADVDVRVPFVDPRNPPADNFLGATFCARPAGPTALMHAAKGGHLKCVVALLQARASVNAELEDGRRPLHFAASSGNYEVGSALICARADISALDGHGLSALDHLPGESPPFLMSRWQAMLGYDQPRPISIEELGYEHRSRTKRRRRKDAGADQGFVQGDRRPNQIIQEVEDNVD
mmetsp:Transcript_110156/g.191014  ORF Transcript_110156/g.191014 Transcript_110156/m.191014 type:complete len:231 (-) Transcript_110156:58-750(-)